MPRRRRTTRGLPAFCPLCYERMRVFERRDGRVEYECEPCVEAAFGQVEMFGAEAAA